jgi:hypothetical protein
VCKLQAEGPKGLAGRVVSPDSGLVAEASREKVTPLGSAFIASKLYDSLFFIGAPVLGLLLVELVSGWSWARQSQLLLGVEQHPVPFFILIWTHAHLFAVFFRSHGNPEIFVQHRFAFIGVPVLLFAAFMASDWVILAGFVVAVFWATYHIGMQNFGLARIYDVRWGNPPEMGRRLDYWLHQLINLGPFLAGMSLLPSLSTFRRFEDVGWKTPGEWVQGYSTIHGVLTPTLLIAAFFFLVYYGYSYWRLTREGYRFCPQKIALLLTTAVVSVIAWGFMTPWKAFFVVNFFHSLQYFALVWWIEKGNLRRLLRVEGKAAGTWLSLLGFGGIVLVFGISYRQYGTDYVALRGMASMALVVALLHYWYDGFIWSVRRREV